ncbi:hypothetical protein [Altererythrobacter sp. MTPC7]|uniref:hypothetical protein n=1 Tax=Altererythrobacter sp. MTPC7 TaxID=3056567 RepID=UPI0036F281FF
MGALWTAVTIIGPILLIGIIVFAWKNNRDASRDSIAKADRGAQKLQDEIERDQTPV